MMAEDDTYYYTDQELEWLDDQCTWYGFDELSEDELELVKNYNCSQYRENDCHGCLYYDPEDQVCRFDK